MRREQSNRQSGFSMIELMVVVLIMLVVAAYAIPNVTQFMHASRLRGAASDYASVLQAGRIRSVQDDTFYSTYILAGNPTQAFVDIQKNGGTQVNPGDPEIAVATEVVPITAANAPGRTNLSGQFLPTGSGVTPKDATTTPVVFSPRGLPCTTQLAGAVCTSAGGPTAYWAFFKNNLNQMWGAVTVSPAGRVQRWIYEGTIWVKF